MSHYGLALRRLCWRGDLSAVRKIIDSQKSINLDIRFGMLKACEAGRVDIVEYLLTLNLKFNYPLLFKIACQQKNINLCEVLFWYVLSETAFQIAVDVGSDEVFDWLSANFKTNVGDKKETNQEFNDNFKEKL